MSEHKQFRMHGIRAVMDIPEQSTIGPWYVMPPDDINNKTGKYCICYATHTLILKRGNHTLTYFQEIDAVLLVDVLNSIFIKNKTT